MRRTPPPDRIETLLGSHRGLSSDEVISRRARFGPNDVVEIPAGAWRELAGETARDPMIWFLVGTGVLYAVLGQLAEAATLLASIVPLAAMDVYLHQRTRASTEGLRTQLAERATVVRDGTTLVVPAADLVPGDLVVVEAGEPFPADGLLEGGEELQAEESTLTGEAHPVRKQPLAARAGEAAPGSIDARHWGFAGTRLLTGRAELRVATTGSETLYGEIVRSAIRGSHARTPLQLAVSHLVAVLLVAATVMCAVLAVVRLRQGHGWLDALVSAITLAVAALPEEFPVVFTLFLGVGVFRLARRQALVRRAVSVENVGRITCICSDKTGTITLGELQLTHRVPVEGTSEAALLELARLASRPETGDPFDVAIEQAAAGAHAAGAHPSDAATTRVLETFPYTEERRRETVVARTADGETRAATKGSPETIFALCRMTDAERHVWLERVEELADGGHKVLACAARPIAERDWPGGEPDRDFRFAGLVACEDPVRAGVREAVDECIAAGIRVIMVTGDHPGTARAVANEIGLGAGDPRVWTSDASDGERERDWPLDEIDVVARAVPGRKVELVRALQARGETVAVTGDGVNDVPALQAADIGIAMGERGTRSAREVAGIVLLDENFRTIVGAIKEGRQLFQNLCLSFEYLLLVHIPLVVSAALIPLAGYPLLYLPIHIVWLEIVIHPTALLAFQELPPPERLARAHTRSRSRFFDAGDWRRIAAIGTLVTVLLVAAYDRSLSPGSVEHARSMTLAILIWTSAGTAAVLSGLRTRSARWIALATAASAVFVLQIRPLATRLHVEPLHLDDWAVALGATGLVVALLLGMRRLHARATQARSATQTAHALP
jgi:Ca2+-transporting ATPase